MKHWISTALMASALCGVSWSVHAANWGDTLRQQASQLGGGSTAASGDSGASSALGGLLGGSGAAGGLLSSLGVPAAGTASNAAGVITYCMKNNYLNANKAQQVKDQLLGKLGLGTQKQEAPKDQGYLNGLGGMITGSNGQSFSMDKLKGDLKEKACDFVLDNAKSLL